MNNDKKISVIVITYNQENTIGRTLDSILMQRCHLPIEIIIGDDCSTDNTLAVCREYETQYPDIIRVLAQKENRGPANNYFDCMLLCQGEYIADCAGDDFWCDPLKLEKEVVILETHPNVTLVHTSWNDYDEKNHSTTEGPQQPFTASITEGHDMLEAIATQTNVQIIHLCTSLYRKNIVLEELGKDEYMFRNPKFGCEDLQVAFVAALHGDIAYLPEKTLNYSVGSESVSNSPDDAKQFWFVWKITNLSHYLVKKYKLKSSVTERYFKMRLFSLFMHAFRAHDKSLRKEAINCQDKWNVKKDCKTEIVLFLTSIEPFWRMALYARKVFVKIKKMLNK